VPVRVTGTGVIVTGVEPPLVPVIDVIVSLRGPVFVPGLNITLIMHVPPVDDVMPVATHELDESTL
jgi:hypothetical protein